MDAGQTNMTRKLTVFDIPTIDTLMGFALELSKNREDVPLTPEHFLRLAREEAAKTTSRKE